jgi:hypothetical protein
MVLLTVRSYLLDWSPTPMRSRLLALAAVGAIIVPAIALHRDQTSVSTP